MSNNIVQLLERTKEVLEERGRTFSSLVNQDGCVCLLGAVGVAALGNEFLDDPTYEWFSGNYYSELSGSNDAREVVEALASAVGDGSWYVDEGDLAYERVYSFNDNTKQDDEVFALINKAMEQAS